MIKSIGFHYEKFNFPCGEMNVRLQGHIKHDSIFGNRILFEFEKNEELIELLLIADALKRVGASIDELVMPYVPFGRQDRVSNYGECLSIAVLANLINSCEPKSVVITDPHSDVTPALINNCKVVHQHEIFAPQLATKKDFWLVSPDGGALKKIYKLASIVDCIGVTECSKLRDTKTGEISGVAVHETTLGGADCYIVDDICDGGRTFIEIAKVLKQKHAGRIILMVTHGFFTKGLQVFDGLIDEIYTRKGKVK